MIGHNRNRRMDWYYKTTRQGRCQACAKLVWRAGATRCLKCRNKNRKGAR